MPVEETRGCGAKRKSPRWIAPEGIGMVWERDVIRFLRMRTRLFGGVVRSLVWLFALGLGLRRSFAPTEGVDYLQFILPGIIAMSIIFSAVQSAISIVWDREFGFLKEILVAPVPRATVVLGKALGGATTATAQGAVVLLLAPLAKINLSPASFFLALLAMFLTALCMSSLGIVIAARLTDFESFSSLQNFITMPMFLLSGAIFPLVDLPRWFHLVLLANPLTYGVDLIRGSLIGLYSRPAYADALVLAALTVLLLAWSIRLFEQEG